MYVISLIWQREYYKTRIDLTNDHKPVQKVNRTCLLLFIDQSHSISFNLFLKSNLFDWVIFSTMESVKLNLFKNELIVTWHHVNDPTVCYVHLTPCMV